MKIAILGSGGREHAIAYAVSKSDKNKKVYCLPGNAGTEDIAENVNVNINNFEQVYNFYKKKILIWLLLDQNSLWWTV